MSRWRDAWKARVLPRDIVDNMDIVAAPARAAVLIVNTVNNVRPPHALESGLDDPVERAAIQAGDRPVRHIAKRMTSWADVANEPAPGDFCGCCAGLLWWTEMAAPLSWRCAWCYPPDHLPPGQFRVIAT